MIRVNSPAWASALGCAALCVGACGWMPAVPIRQDSAPKFASPEACFESLRAAHESDDPAAVLPCLSEATLNFLAGSLALDLQQWGAVSQGGEAAAACRKVLQTHGLADAPMMDFLQIVDSSNLGAGSLGFMQIGDCIQDKVTFFREASAARNQISEIFPSESLPETSQQKRLAKLMDVKIDGHKAEALAMCDDETTETVFFQVENGSWVVAFNAQEPDWRKPIGGRFLFSDLLGEQRRAY